VEPGGREPVSDDPAVQAELGALLRLRLTPRVGDLAVGRLLDAFGSAQAAVDSPSEAFAGVAGEKAARGRHTPEVDRRIDETLRWAREMGVRVVGRGLPGYPARLLHLADPPPILFMLGRTELLRETVVTVVGTRKATGAGRRFALELGRVVSGLGVPVASGLALGIDAAAHRGALEGRGSTVAVLGSGLDRAHPASHRELQARILREGGLLVSEFLPGDEVRPHHFPRRNRILAGLAHVVVVVEAGVPSGATITADMAADLGRWVFTVPGAVDYPQSQGTNELLREGALPLTRPGDLVEELWRKGLLHPDDLPAVRGDGLADTRGLGEMPDPHGILDLLRARALPLAELERRVGLPPSQLLPALSELELMGGAVRDPEGWRLPDREVDRRLVAATSERRKRRKGKRR
jgi:DNA processing protein